MDIVDIAELSAAEFSYEGIAQAYKDPEQKKLLCNIKYKGSVKAGINMTDIDFAVDHEKRRIVATMPETTLKVYIDNENELEFVPSNPNIPLRDRMEVCELATLRYYYHNVSELQNEASRLFGYGYKKLWMEYGGMVEIGINAHEVVISAPNAEGVVSIYVPEAKVLKVTADKESLSKPITGQGCLPASLARRRPGLLRGPNKNAKAGCHRPTAVGEGDEQSQKAAGAVCHQHGVGHGTEL